LSVFFPRAENKFLAVRIADGRMRFQNPGLGERTETLPGAEKGVLPSEWLKKASGIAGRMDPLDEAGATPACPWIVKVSGRPAGSTSASSKASCMEPVAVSSKVGAS
jgi:hypothetical protein